MTREEAIQFLDNMKHEEAGKSIGKDGFYAELMGYHVEALNMAIKALEQRWIQVSEGLPEDMQRVLIWFEYYRYGDFNCMYQTYGFGYVYDGKWSPFINGETGWKDARIIAWMPLPEPMKVGEENC